MLEFTFTTDFRVSEKPFGLHRSEAFGLQQSIFEIDDSRIDWMFMSSSSLFVFNSFVAELLLGLNASWYSLSKSVLCIGYRFYD